MVEESEEPTTEEEPQEESPRKSPSRRDLVFKCGHRWIGRLNGGKKASAEFAEWVKANRLCKFCYKEEMRRKREEESAAALTLSEQLGWPPLRGTPPQIHYAASLRAKALGEILDVRRQIEDRVKDEPIPDFNHEIVLAKIHWLTRQDIAKFWIDRRMTNWKTYLAALGRDREVQ